MENMKRDAAESCFHLGRIDEGDRRFEDLAKQYPQSQWVYIGWGDMYSPRIAPKDVCDLDRSRDLYERALDVTDDFDEDEIKGRISMLSDSL